MEQLVFQTAVSAGLSADFNVTNAGSDGRRYQFGLNSFDDLLSISGIADDRENLKHNLMFNLAVPSSGQFSASALPRPRGATLELSASISNIGIDTGINILTGRLFRFYLGLIRLSDKSYRLCFFHRDLTIHSENN